MPRFLALAALLLTAPLRAEELKGIFPCDPAEFKKPPVLALLGERHHYPNSDAVKKLAIRASARGDYHGLFEASITGAMRPKDAAKAVRDLGFTEGQARLYGLDQSPASVYTLLWLWTSPHAEPSPAWGVSAVQDMLEMIQVYPEFRAPYVAALRAGAITDPRTVKLIGDAAVAGAAHPDAMRGSKPSLTVLSRDVPHAKAAAVAARVEAARGMGRDYEQAEVDRIVASLGPDADAKNIDDGLMIRLRDRDYAQTVASHWCSAAREGKNVAVGVGENHAAGMEKFLRSWAGPASLDIVTIETSGAAGSKKAIALLESWSAGR